MAEQPQRVEDPRHPTAEQQALFEIARSRQLREDSHTTTSQGPAAGSASPPAGSGGAPNPRYQGLGGIFNVVTDALSGTYQPVVRK